MPLSADLQKLVLLIQDPTERAAQEKRLLELEEGGLRQSDYDRKMDEGKRERERLEAELRTQITNNQQWWDRNKKTFDDTVATLEQTERERDELKAKVNSSVNNNSGTNGNGAVDPAQLKSLVEAEFAGRKYVSVAEVETVTKRIAGEIAAQEREKFFKETLPASTEFTMAMNDLQFSHRDEFGKPLDRTAFSKFITEQKLQVGTADDLKKAHDSFVFKERQEATFAKMRAEIEKDVKSKHNVPGTGATPSPSELGPLQQRLQKAQGMPEIIFDDSVKPGSGALAAAAAAELRAEGKG